MIIIDDDGVMHKVLPIEVLDKIRAEIETYEADCILADDSKECKECDKVVFGSIYRIIDKYTKGESEIWNTPNADNRIVAPKGTFKKIYEDEDDDNDI